MGRIIAVYFFILIGIFSCESRRFSEIGNIVDLIKEQYAPDSRTVIFQIVIVPEKPVIVSGETNMPQAKEALVNKLNQAGFAYIDSIKILPNRAVLAEINAVINVSVANLRSQPKHSAEQVTQALLGTPVKVLKKKGGWYLVQTPDQYISWASGSNLQLMTDDEFRAWKDAEKLVYLPTYGFSVDSVGDKVSDLVAGNILNIVDEGANTWTMRYPDGRTALIAKDHGQQLTKWMESIVISEQSIISMAKDLMGVPYMWGGTSPKGVDCSGFTKTVYFRHGLVLPRDASQQVHVGKLIDDQRDFSRLEVGDLLFFGRKNEDGSERVIHVGLWIGDNTFIHASGDVHISSMDSTSDVYDSYNYERYLRTKRIIGFEADLPIEIAEIY